jgi:hypothetical protein
MDIGMLWRDDDKERSLEEKVKRAVTYYREKYGRMPNTCFVHMGMLPNELRVDKVVVRPAKDILPQHFWIGIQKA